MSSVWTMNLPVATSTASRFPSAATVAFFFTEASVVLSMTATTAEAPMPADMPKTPLPAMPSISVSFAAEITILPSACTSVVEASPPPM